MNLYMLCGALGENPFEERCLFVNRDVGQVAVQMLREVVSLCDSECLGRNPIATWELLASNQKVAYCPFAYGYSNYWRRGYAPNLLQPGGLVRLENGHPCRSTLGGTGLAISSGCPHKSLAVGYVQFVASAECQAGLYFDSGGQPGYRAAWLNRPINQRSNNFFAGTLATLDDAYLRPRFDGYLEFQDKASLVLHEFLSGGGSETRVIDDLNRLAAGYTRARDNESL
jgi:multiple sugar transport system substrate-binding protein